MSRSWMETDITFDTKFYLHKITVNIGTLLIRIKSPKLPKTEAQSKIQSTLKVNPKHQF